MIEREFWEERIKKAHEDLKTLENTKFNYRHLMVELLKNKIQEWYEILEEFDNSQ